MKGQSFMYIGDFLIRIVVGLIFFLAGLTKFRNLEGTTSFFDSLGIPLPFVAALSVASIELIGGFMLIVGLWTMIPSVLLSVVMIVAILLVHLEHGWSSPNGIRYPLLLLVGCVRYIGGAGVFGVQGLFNRR